MTLLTSLGTILRAAVAGLALPRLAWGAMVVLVIIVLGRAADWCYLAAGGTPVSPSGFSGGGWTDDQQNMSQRAAQTAVARFAGGTTVGQQQKATSTSTPGELRAILDASYLEKIANAPSPSLDTSYRENRTRIAGLRPRGPAEALGDEIASALRQMALAIRGLAPLAAINTALAALVDVPAGLIGFAPWYALFVCLPLLGLASAAGGGLARMSAWETGRGLKLPLADATRFVRAAWLRLALVPILPALGAALAIFVMAVIGALLRVPVLDLIGGFLYGIALLLSMLIVIAGAGFAVGWPMAIGSVASGDGDAMDAFVRVSSYFLRRPGRAILSLATAMLAVSLGLLLAGGVAALGLGLAQTCVGFWGGATALHAAGDAGLIAPASGSTPLPGATARAAAAFIDLWESVVVLLVAGAAMSLIADAATRAYLMLREACDGQDPNAIDGVPLDRPRID